MPNSLNLSSFTGDNNLALHKPAWQSSTLWPRTKAGRAVDGDNSPDFAQRSCTHTSNDPIPWLTVDLQQQYTIEKVIITNRNYLGT